MKVAVNNFLVKVDDKISTVKIQGADGRMLFVDTDYNKYSHSARIGKVFALPISITSNYKNDIKLREGDDVIFHHFVCQKDHKVDLGEGVYRCEYFHIYAKLLDGYVVPLEDILFVEPIKEKETDLFCGKIQVKATSGVVKQQGIVYALSNSAKDLGIQVGDKVFYTLNADYKLPINGLDMCRMRIRNILAVERDGKMVCLKNKVFIREIKSENKSGVLYDLVEKSELEGEIIEVGESIYDVKKGDIVSYNKGIQGDVFINGQILSFIDLKNINYIK